LDDIEENRIAKKNIANVIRMELLEVLIAAEKIEKINNKE